MRQLVDTATLCSDYDTFQFQFSFLYEYKKQMTIYDLLKNCFIFLVISGIDIGFDIKRTLA